MKKHITSNRIIRSSLILALALACWSPLQAQPPGPEDGKMKMDGKMMMKHCQEMKDKKEKMMEDIKAQDAQLSEQIRKMNSAPQGEKLELLATVVTQMADQQKTMNARKAKMEEEMMKHMMQHMEMGKKSMAECPMMKGMKDMEEKSDGDHQEHHHEDK